MKISPDDDFNVTIKESVDTKLFHNRTGRSNTKFEISESGTNLNESLTVKDKHLHNVRQILLCTNATPIRSYSGAGYNCAFCKNNYSDASHLKIHTLDVHKDDEKRRFMRNYRLVYYVAKIDVTDLECSICQESINLFDDLVKHLTSQHDKVWYMDVENRILPFKFRNTDVICAVCSKIYHSLRFAQIHMTKHFRNYRCRICSAYFINIHTLKGHLRKFHPGENPCNFCSEIFSSKSERDDHESDIHNDSNNKSSQCTQKTNSLEQKRENTLKMHEESYEYEVVDKPDAHSDTTTNDEHYLELEEETTQRSAVNSPIELEPVEDGPDVSKNMTVKGKHLHNLRQILLYTNATPIRRYTGTAYACGFCAGLYPKPADLKKHTLEIHTEDEINSYMSDYPLVNYVAKIDVTNLECSICQESINLLDDLVKHLTSQHDKIWYIDVENRILPFKFRNADVICAVCSKTYHSLRLAQIHMTKHFRNYLCSICCASFINLQGHLRKFHPGKNPCNFCSKIFSSKSERDDHDSDIHNDSKNKSSHCTQKTNSLEQKRENTLKMHEESYEYEVVDKPDADSDTTTNDEHYLELEEETTQRSAVNSPIELEPVEDGPDVSKNMTVKGKHLHNLRQILLYTNATPIRRYTGTAYACGFCAGLYPKPADLKKHTLEIHTDDEINSYMSDYRLVNYVAKIDVTNLECSICQESINLLDDLVKHLTSQHDKIWYMDVENRILPFKFRNADVICAVCSKTYLSLRLAQIHMTKHFRNYLCSICSASFINHHTLKGHLRKFHSEENPCNFCSEIFSSKSERDDHESDIHNDINNKSSHCTQKTNSLEQKRENTLKMHEESYEYEIVEKPDADSDTITNDEHYLELEEETTQRSAVNSPIELEPVEDGPDVSKNMTVKGRHLHNLRQILLYTNATPIRRYTGTAYACGFCAGHYPKPADLKKHTLEIHTDDEINSYMSDYPLIYYVAKIDVTDLECSICQESIDSFYDLIKHITSQHNIVWFTDIANRILSFKFINNGVSCAACSETFKSLKLAQRHMVVHFKNYSCTICSANFVNQHYLQGHLRRQHPGEIPCRFCSENFSSKSDRYRHERVIHRGSIGKNSCPHCIKKFTSYEQKLDHLILIHGKFDQEVIEETEESADNYTMTKDENRLSEMAINPTIEGKLAESTADGNTNLTEKDKHLHNIRQVLLCTNATPIRSYIGAGYCCGFCRNHYPDPRDLKRHTLLEHNDGQKHTFMHDYPLINYVVKIDITNLQCTFCQETIDNFDDLVQHLTAIHNIVWYTEVPNRILSFKFQNEEVICTVCLKSYHNFKLAQEHMSVHYGHFLCNICNSQFINKRTLQRHLDRHNEGEFACSYCSKLFGTAIKRENHERLVHIGDLKRNKCPYCFEKFSTYKRRIDHMILEHGKSPLVLNCKACSKSFSSTAQLRQHTKRYHLMERPHECQLCDMKFFSAGGLDNHMVKHTGVKKYKCELCLKSYGRKRTLREHLRIHADDRRFKCELCDQAFVQKCSMKSHMRTKHGVVIPNV